MWILGPARCLKRVSAVTGIPINFLAQSDDITVRIPRKHAGLVADIIEEGITMLGSADHGGDKDFMAAENIASELPDKIREALE